MRRLPLDYAVRNLGRSQLRLLLSVLGNALVVLLLLAAGAFVRGMVASLQHAGEERNVLIMGIGSEESIERSEIPAATASLLSASVPGLRTRLGAPFVSPEVHVQLPARAAGAAAGGVILVRGMTPSALLVHGQVQIRAGTLPRSGHDEVLVGRLTYTNLGVAAGALAVGKKLQIEGREWTISGVLAAPQSVMDGEIWMPRADLKQLVKRETDSCVIATLDGGPSSAELADVQAFCRQRLDLEITAMTESSYYRQLAAFFAPIRAVTWITAGLIALSGLFGGLNAMYAAFASRVREVGMLQCLGYRRSAIVLSLVQESCLSAVCGALLAAVAALLLLDGMAVQFSLGAFGLRVDPPALLVGLCAGLVLGVIGALPPAWRCLRQAIPEALKAI